MPRIFVSAGETSGDRHTAAVLRHVNNLLPGVELAGLGGEASRAQGVQLLAGLDRLSVLGFWDVARRLPDLRRVFKKAEAFLGSWKPDLALFVDYPGFNLRLAAKAKTMGIPVVYYIAPQVWAWKRERRPGIARAVDELLVVFPFEESLFREAGIAASFVGHPLMDAAAPMPKAQVQEALDAGERKMIGLFPGSRIQEVRKILPVLVDGVRRLDLEKVLPVVSVRPELDPALYRDAREAGFRLWDGDAASLASAADAALVASGTATLETGLTGTPMGVVYKTGRLNALIARSVIKLQTVGLVNIVAGGSRVPELLQTRLTGDAVKGLAQKLLFDPVERREQQEYLSVLPHRLGGPGASRRVAERIVQHLAEP